ncbi:hypothetical protein MHM84_11835 [Halomonas sp. McH1-25]|uniref:hypothetical protein n=1 Tax=unclassified Halomonas TaxID=2609666 RepID=UPI001EF4D240|nr:MULTISPECIES: hypothetical protein [unclassified Halomonas]MCG7600481.1 hypothetical protein [Halomonas sp. McH1-25]MCP1342920.1 hypothetical protein [Halomonas sp. FL8]MCP1359988.1 hypothetical protein [Halomonas sp. BBD45]MCP1364709.1 hypothetical protein [Halomonas sp. BBD48]
MDAPGFRQRNGKKGYCPIIAGIAMLALPIALSANESAPARIAQHTQGSVQLEESLIVSGILPNQRGNGAIIQQIGSDNSARIEQSLTNGYSQGNLAWLYQNGYNNVADISQAGGNNLGIVLQKGNDFSASINQTGNELNAAIKQFGVNAKASVNQFGSASRGVSIEQLSRSGTGMTVTVETR